MFKINLIAFLGKNKTDLVFSEIVVLCLCSTVWGIRGKGRIEHRVDELQCSLNEGLSHQHGEIQTLDVFLELSHLC